ncbi:Zn-dependent hydrolase [Miniimonas arenae]|nr:Zn-dependent hydrolase [Miniimonas arenae]
MNAPAMVGQRRGRRAWDRCQALAAVTAVPGRVDRFYLTPQHRQATMLVAGWMRESGLRIWVDEAGNLHGTTGERGSHRPRLVLGSHLDTVPDAGRFDGVAGVMAAIEVAGELAGSMPFDLEVVGFGDEEGTRFGHALLGSRALAGTWEDAWWSLEDADGVSLERAFLDFGLDPERIGAASYANRDLVGYLEVHIEQGPTLDRAHVPLGVVSSIASARRFQVEVLGESRHSGGTPFDERHDALLGAAEAVVAVERLSLERQVIGTVGRLEVAPGAVNVIPGTATFTVDMRARHDHERDDTIDALTGVLEEVSERRGLRYRLQEIHAAPAVFCSERLLDAAREGVDAVQTQDVPTLFSPAGHDGMAVAAVTDVAMIFMRNPDGISHHPAEYVSPDDLGLGIAALTTAVRALA